MNPRVVINVATTLAGGNAQYVDWQDRLINSLDPFAVDVLAWRDEYPPGSPTHKEVPYAFKPFAFSDAARRGYSSILWCDAGVWARKDPAPVFDLMERQGYVLFRNGWNCGQWATDAALMKQGFTRDEASTVPDFTGCCMGLDLASDVGAEFQSRWWAAARDGVSFGGAWTNELRQCSADPRCLGHRHDQVIGSLIAHRMGLTLTDPGTLFSYWNGGAVNDSVVLVNGR